MAKILFISFSFQVVDAYFQIMLILQYIVRNTLLVLITGRNKNVVGWQFFQMSYENEQLELCNKNKQSRGWINLSFRKTVENIEYYVFVIIKLASLTDMLIRKRL